MDSIVAMVGQTIQSKMRRQAMGRGKEIGINLKSK